MIHLNVYADAHHYPSQAISFPVLATPRQIADLLGVTLKLRQ